MKAKVMLLVAVALLALGCEGDLNPTEPPLPCNDRVYEEVRQEHVKDLPCRGGGD